MFAAWPPLTYSSDNITTIPMANNSNNCGGGSIPPSYPLGFLAISQEQELAPSLSASLPRSRRRLATDANRTFLLGILQDALALVDDDDEDFLS